MRSAELKYEGEKSTGGGKATGCGERWMKEWEEALPRASFWRFFLLHVWCVFFFFNFNQILGSTCSICYVVELFEICCAFCVPVCEEFTVNQPEPQHR